ncbi:MAG: hypothetical protein A3I66_19385 [Burkholderiales bacterium RIFCSPLOWO2_02_FULL_57_36]|nr:MAG: hypothetical protein A3I66_19385 [Burkholderiales bacterium RIFCSPLOWO2_02_FULL_57_36]
MVWLEAGNFCRWQLHLTIVFILHRCTGQVDATQTDQTWLTGSVRIVIPCLWDSIDLESAYTIAQAHPRRT